MSRHVTNAATVLCLVLFPSCESISPSGESGNAASPAADSPVPPESNLEAQRGAIEDFEAANLRFRTALQDYQSSATPALSEGALDEMASAWIEWKAAWELGRELGVRSPTSEETVERFIAATDNWLASQQELHAGFRPCRLSSNPSQDELLSCVTAHPELRRLLKQAIRLSTRVLELQGEVLSSGS